MQVNLLRLVLCVSLYVCLVFTASFTLVETSALNCTMNDHNGCEPDFESEFVHLYLPRKFIRLWRRGDSREEARSSRLYRVISYHPLHQKYKKKKPMHHYNTSALIQTAYDRYRKEPFFTQ